MMYNERLYKRYGWTAKPMEEATNARLASVSTVEWLIFLRTKRKERRPGKIWLLYKPKLRVNRLRVIRIRKVCESMRFDSGPEVFVRVNRNYVLTEYVQNENDCTPSSSTNSEVLQHRIIHCNSYLFLSPAWNAPTFVSGTSIWKEHTLKKQNKHEFTYTYKGTKEQLLKRSKQKFDRLKVTKNITIWTSPSALSILIILEKYHNNVVEKFLSDDFPLF